MLGKLEKKVSALKDGDGSAFDQIYEQTNRSVYFAALYIVHEKMAAEDVMQETYIKAIRSIHLYRSGTNFVAWICSIARNLALNHLRKYSREMSADMESEPYKYGTTDPNIPYIFDIASRVLKEDEYEIVMLCQVAGYKRREVAEMLGIPIGTVTWKNNEALKKLKQELTKEVGS